MSASRTADTERLAHLERYLQAWLRTHTLKVSDLGKAEVWNRLVKTFSADMKIVMGKGGDLAADYVGLRIAEVASGALKQGISKLFGGKG